MTEVAAAKTGWWMALDRERQIMLTAIVVMTASQFFHYQGAYIQHLSIGIVGGGGGDHVVADLNTGAAIAAATNPVAGVSGWSLHHHAWMVLAALAAVFALAPRVWAWRGWAYWAGVFGLITCLFPTPMELSPPGAGYIGGLIAVAIGVWAARVNGKAIKMEKTA
jgi:hypothetical protein